MAKRRKRTYLDYALDVFGEEVNLYDERYFEEEINLYGERYRRQVRFPKNFDWRPYRLCVRDVVLGMVVVCHYRRDNLLEVKVCLSTDINVFPPYSGAKVVTSFLLSEAFKCGGSMEIRFDKKHILQGRVPSEICALAYELDVELNHVFEGHITPAEARKLYLAITDFSEEALQKVMRLSVEGKISPERVCFMVHHGVWTLPEIESILLGSESPDRLLLGNSLPEMRHLYLNDLLHARAAVLGGFLDRKLARRERGNDERAIELEGDERRIDITFDPRFYAKVYQSREQLPVPWAGGNGKRYVIPPGHRMVVMVCPRTSAGFQLHFEDDLQVAIQMGKAHVQGADTPVYGFVLVPRDFEEIPDDERLAMVQAAQKIKKHIMVCPETVQGLDEDAATRLKRSRILRR